MKFLLDENLGIKIPQFLRSLKFDVLSILELSPGMTDQEVLKLANKDNRILITLDKDFGELVFKEGLLHSGVILLRLNNNSIDNKKKIILKALNTTKNYSNKFTVIRDKPFRKT
jgi:predicted nuclease of predicted toxin-antitoxin system